MLTCHGRIQQLLTVLVSNVLNPVVHGHGDGLFADAFTLVTAYKTHRIDKDLSRSKISVHNVSVISSFPPARTHANITPHL